MRKALYAALAVTAITFLAAPAQQAAAATTHTGKVTQVHSVRHHHHYVWAWHPDHYGVWRGAYWYPRHYWYAYPRAAWYGWGWGGWYM